MRQKTKQWQPQRRRNQRRSRLIVIASRVSLVCALLFLGYGLIDIWLSSNDERYYFTSSQYNGVTSKFVTRDTLIEKTSIEYPITNSPAVNAFVAKEISAVDQEFRQTVQRGSQLHHQQMTQTITYQITLHTDEYISLVLHIKQDTLGAHPTAMTKFWTLRKKDAAPVTTRQLVGDSDAGMNRLMKLVKSRVAAIAQQRGMIANQRLAEDLPAEAFRHFLAQDRNTISFPFGAGVIVPSSYGDMTLAVSVADMKDSLQHPLAKQLFTVPAPTPPTPQPAPAPSPQTAATQSTNTPCANRPCVALTFDDGPGPHTERLLNTLRDKQAKASFFVLGSKASQHPGTLRRIAREGHDIGNHSWNHPNLTSLSAAAVRDDLARTNATIKHITGSSPILARAPYGAVNPIVQAELRSLGMASIMWSVDTRDWADRNSEIICQRAVGSAQSGAIILLHDIHGTSVDAVPCIIDGLAKQGYQLVTVQQLLGVVTAGQEYRSR